MEILLMTRTSTVLKSKINACYSTPTVLYVLEGCTRKLKDYTIQKIG